jgi:hypothetical protein
MALVLQLQKNDGRARLTPSNAVRAIGALLDETSGIRRTWPDRDVQGLVIAITTDEERGSAVAERQPNVRAVFLARCDATWQGQWRNRRSAAEDQAAFGGQAALHGIKCGR